MRSEECHGDETAEGDAVLQRSHPTPSESTREDGQMENAVEAMCSQIV